MRAAFFMHAAMIRFHVMNAVTNKPCLACGACCMSYRVSFYWADAEQRGPAAVRGRRLSVPRVRPASDPCREVQIGDDNAGRPGRATACHLCSFSGHNENIYFVLLC
jgi:Fe-S-cluster containining protein